MADTGRQRPRVILLGTKPGAIVALETMLDRGFHVVAVVTGEGDSHPWFGGPTLRSIARARGLPVFPRQTDLPAGGDVDLVISYMFRSLVRPPLLARARLAALNFHCAPLPEYGGYAFYNVAILEGAREYGCTCHHMDASFDTGPLLEVRRFPIDAEQETARSLEQKAQACMVELFVDFCAAVQSGEPLGCVPQPAGRMRYLSQPEFEALKEVPAGADAKTIDRHARAFWFPPYPGARLRDGERTLPLRPTVVDASDAVVSYAANLAHLRHVRQQHESHRTVRV